MKSTHNVCDCTYLQLPVPVSFLMSFVSGALLSLDMRTSSSGLCSYAL